MKGRQCHELSFLENSNSEVVAEFDFCGMANNPRALSGADSYKSGSSLNLAELIKGSITIYKKIPGSFFKYMKSSSNMKNTHSELRDRQSVLCLLRMTGCLDPRWI